MAHRFNRRHATADTRQGGTRTSAVAAAVNRRYHHGKIEPGLASPRTANSSCSKHTTLGPYSHRRRGWQARGRLRDHWVLQANPVMQKQVNTWADKNKVEATMDFTSASLQMTGAAEAQAKSGHDMYTFFNWNLHNVAGAFEPVDDVIKQLVEQNGAISETCEYLAKVNGHWIAVPTSSGTQTKPPCARISWFRKAGLDLQAMYPVKAEHNALQDAGLGTRS